MVAERATSEAGGRQRAIVLALARVAQVRPSALRSTCRARLLTPRLAALNGQLLKASAVFTQLVGIGRLHVGVTERCRQTESDQAAALQRMSVMSFTHGEFARRRHAAFAHALG